MCEKGQIVIYSAKRKSPFRPGPSHVSHFKNCKKNCMLFLFSLVQFSTVEFQFTVPLFTVVLEIPCTNNKHL